MCLNFLFYHACLGSCDQLREGLPENSDEFAFDRAIDVRVSRLRSKLKDPSKNPKIIKTIYGAGYIFMTDGS